MARSFPARDIAVLFGGVLAVSLTDFVQGCIMFLALVLVPIVAMINVGGPAETAEMPPSKTTVPLRSTRAREDPSAIRSASSTRASRC